VREIACVQEAAGDPVSLCLGAVPQGGIPAAYLDESGRVQVPDRAAARCIPSLAALYGLRSAKRRTTQVREILTRPLPDLGEPGQPAARAEQ